MIEVKSVSKSFNGQVVLDNVSFNIKDGEIFIILGESGAGKSVLLKHLVGLIAPDKGKLFINGIDVGSLSERKLLEEERDWHDLTARFSLAKEKVRLYEDLEKAQQEKLEHERTRQKAGRTTMAQVIQFENDFEQTQFARIRSLAELLNLNAQMKLYGVAYE